MFIMSIVGILNILFVIIVPHFFELELTSRISLSNIMKKVGDNFYNFYNIIFDCYGYFPKYLLLLPFIFAYLLLY